MVEVPFGMGSNSKLQKIQEIKFRCGVTKVSKCIIMKVVYNFNDSMIKFCIKWEEKLCRHGIFWWVGILGIVCAII